MAPSWKFPFAKCYDAQKVALACKIEKQNHNQTNRELNDAIKNNVNKTGMRKKEIVLFHLIKQKFRPF